MSCNTEASWESTADGPAETRWETFERDTEFVRTHPDDSEESSRPAKAFFDINNVKGDMISALFANEERLGPVTWYPNGGIQVTSSPLSTGSVRIVGEMDARWRAFDESCKNQTLFFGRKFYQCHFLVVEIEGDALFDVIFCMQTMKAFGLFDPPSAPWIL